MLRPDSRDSDDTFYEARFLQHFGGTVPIESCRQRTADRRHCAFGQHSGARLDDASAKALLCFKLCGAGRLGRHLRRSDAQGPRDVHHQCGQSLWLSAHAFRLPPASVLRRRRHRRSSIFSCQVRHSHRTSSTGKTGYRQWLDRRSDGRIHHSGRCVGRRFDQA